MEFLQSLHLVLSISSLFPVLLMKNSVFAGPTGLSLKLIHIDSPESPLYPGNLTQEERMKRDFERSESRHQQLTASIKSWVRNNNSISPDRIRAPISYDGIFYVALLGIGTFPGRSHKYYYFGFDTGSALLWLQCERCNPCYPQVDDYYPAEDSATYRKVPCNSHPLCTRGVCREGFCSYDIKYSDGSRSQGVLATETLFLNADHGGEEVIGGYFFGCGLAQENIHFSERGRTTRIAGILGLGGGAQSFLRQLGLRGQMRFGYCLELWSHNEASSTFLRFGSDAYIGGGQVIQTTPMYFGRDANIYYVDLYDISIDGERMGYPKGSFRLKREGTGGTVFDSGTPWTLMALSIYVPLRNRLIDYFAALNVRTTLNRPHERYEICFTMPDGFFRFPTITFHFNQADLEVEPQAAFFMNNEVFCFAILPVNDGYVTVILGAIQLGNHRVLHDVYNHQISWAKEDCSLNP